MTSQREQLQALIAEIDAMLSKASPKLPWVASNETAQQRSLLEKARTYLQTLQQSVDLPGDGGVDPAAIAVSDLSSLEASSEASASSVLQTLLQELQYLRGQMLQPLRAEIGALQQEREALLREVRQLELTRQQMQTPAALDQSSVDQLFQVLAERLEGQLRSQIEQSVQRLDAERLDIRLLSESATAPPELGNPLPQLTPTQRLEQLRYVQQQSDELVLNLDKTLRAVFEALQQSIYSYQDSLSQGLDNMHTLGQQGEMMFNALISHLAQQMSQEGATYLEPGRVDRPAQLPVARQEALTEPDPSVSLEGQETGAAAPDAAWDDLDALDLDMDFDEDEEITLFQLDDEITRLQLDQPEPPFDFEPNLEDEPPTVIQTGPDSQEGVEEPALLDPLQVLEQLDEAASSPEPLVEVRLAAMAATPAEPLLDEGERYQELDELYETLFGEDTDLSPEDLASELSGIENPAPSEATVDLAAPDAGIDEDFAEDSEQLVEADLSLEAVSPLTEGELGIADLATQEAIDSLSLFEPEAATEDLTTLETLLFDQPVDQDAPALEPPESGLLALEIGDATSGLDISEPLPAQAESAETLDTVFGSDFSQSIREETSVEEPAEVADAIASLAELLPDEDDLFDGYEADVLESAESSAAEEDAFIAASAEEDLLATDDLAQSSGYGIEFGEATLEQLDADLSRLEEQEPAVPPTVPWEEPSAEGIDLFLDMDEPLAAPGEPPSTVPEEFWREIGLSAPAVPEPTAPDPAESVTPVDAREVGELEAATSLDELVGALGSTPSPETPSSPEALNDLPESDLPEMDSLPEASEPAYEVGELEAATSLDELVGALGSTSSSAETPWMLETPSDLPESDLPETDMLPEAADVLEAGEQPMADASPEDEPDDFLQSIVQDLGLAGSGPEPPAAGESGLTLEALLAASEAANPPSTDALNPASLPPEPAALASPSEPEPDQNLPSAADALTSSLLPDSLLPAVEPPADLPAAADALTFTPPELTLGPADADLDLLSEPPTAAPGADLFADTLFETLPEPPPEDQETASLNLADFIEDLSLGELPFQDESETLAVTAESLFGDDESAMALSDRASPIAPPDLPPDLSIADETEIQPQDLSLDLLSDLDLSLEVSAPAEVEAPPSEPQSFTLDDFGTDLTAETAPLVPGPLLEPEDSPAESLMGTAAGSLDATDEDLNDLLTNVASILEARGTLSLDPLVAPESDASSDAEPDEANSTPEQENLLADGDWSIDADAPLSSRGEPGSGSEEIQPEEFAINLEDLDLFGVEPEPLPSPVEPETELQEASFLADPAGAEGLDLFGDAEATPVPETSPEREVSGPEPAFDEDFNTDLVPETLDFLAEDFTEASETPAERLDDEFSAGESTAPAESAAPGEALDAETLNADTFAINLADLDLFGDDLAAEPEPLETGSGLSAPTAADAELAFTLGDLDLSEEPQDEPLPGSADANPFSPEAAVEESINFDELEALLEEPESDPAAVDSDLTIVEPESLESEPFWEDATLPGDFNGSMDEALEEPVADDVADASEGLPTPLDPASQAVWPTGELSNEGLSLFDNDELDPSDLPDLLGTAESPDSDLAELLSSTSTDADATDVPEVSEPAVPLALEALLLEAQPDRVSLSLETDPEDAEEIDFEAIDFGNLARWQQAAAAPAESDPEAESGELEGSTLARFAEAAPDPSPDLSMEELDLVDGDDGLLQSLLETATAPAPFTWEDTSDLEQDEALEDAAEVDIFTPIGFADDSDDDIDGEIDAASSRELPALDPDAFLPEVAPELPVDPEPELDSEPFAELIADEAEASTLDPALTLEELPIEPDVGDASTTAPRTAWFLGVDIGTTGLSAVLLNQTAGQVYPLYWVDNTISGVTADKFFRLPTIASVSVAPVDRDSWRLQSVGSSALTVNWNDEDGFEQGENDSVSLLLKNFKPLLKLGIPYQEDSGRDQPLVQWSETVQVPMQAVQASLQALLATLRNPSGQSPLSAGAVGLDEAAIAEALSQLQGVIVSYPANWPDTYSFNLREAVLGAGLAVSPDQIYFIEDAIAAVLSGLPNPEEQEPAASTQPLRQQTLYACNWSGGTVVISAGASLTELGVVYLPRPLNRLSYSDFGLHSLAYAGDGIDLDIIAHLLHPAERRQVRTGQTDSSPTDPGWGWQAALPELDQADWADLDLDGLEMPRIAEPDLPLRYQLQQRLESSVLGQSALEAARHLKLILQHQNQFELKLANQRWTVRRKDLENRIVLPYIQRINGHLNRLMSQAGLTAQGINQVVCTGGTASLPAITRWLRQKFPNATIIQDTYPNNRPPSCSRVAYGLVNLVRYPQVLDLTRHQYSDTFLLMELVRTFPDQPMPLNGILHLLEQRGINTHVCEMHLIALLEGRLPPGLVPSTGDVPPLSQASVQESVVQALHNAPLFTRQNAQIYVPNTEQCQRLLAYLAAMLAGKYQQLEEPLLVQLGTGVPIV